MPDYTVILQPPDYLDLPAQIYYVRARQGFEAIDRARSRAAERHEFTAADDTMGFALIAVFRGHLAPELTDEHQHNE